MSVVSTEQVGTILAKSAQEQVKAGYRPTALLGAYNITPDVFLPTGYDSENLTVLVDEDNVIYFTGTTTSINDITLLYRKSFKDNLEDANISIRATVVNNAGINVNDLELKYIEATGKTVDIPINSNTSVLCYDTSTATDETVFSITLRVPNGFDGNMMMYIMMHVADDSNDYTGLYYPPVLTNKQLTDRLNRIVKFNADGAIDLTQFVTNDQLTNRHFVDEDTLEEHANENTALFSRGAGKNQLQIRHSEIDSESFYSYNFDLDELGETKSITINGTSEESELDGNIIGVSEVDLCTDLEIEPGSYILSGVSEYNGNIRLNAIGYDENKQNRVYYGATSDTDGSDLLFTINNVSNYITVQLSILTGTTLTDAIIHPMLRRADITDDTFESFKPSNFDLAKQLNQLGGTGQSTAQVQAAIQEALQDYSTTTEMNSAINTSANSIIQRKLYFTDISVAASSFTNNSGLTDYPYKAVITCNGVTANHLPHVVFSLADSISGKLAPICESGANTVTIYATEATACTINCISCELITS